MVNAFWLDRNLAQAAAWLVDSHVTSSVFECSMVLTTAAHLNGLREEDLYVTHENHPLTRWAADAHENWSMLLAYTEAAHEEWRYRWDHDETERHACWATVESLDRAVIRGLEWPEEVGVDPPQVTGGWTAADYVDAYRYYYANEKRHLFEWSKDRGEPPWVAAYTVEGGARAGGFLDVGECRDAWLVSPGIVLQASALIVNQSNIVYKNTDAKKLVAEVLGQTSRAQFNLRTVLFRVTILQGRSTT